MLNIVVETAFLSALFLNAFFALKAGDHRLKGVAILFLALWVVTHYFPYTEVLVSPISFVLLSRLQIRREGEKKLARWMVPVVAAEAGIFLSHLAYPSLGYLAYWVLIQILFAAQLTVTLTVGARLALKRDPESSRVKPGFVHTKSEESLVPSR